MNTKTPLFTPFTALLLTMGCTTTTPSDTNQEIELAYMAVVHTKDFIARDEKNHDNVKPPVEAVLLSDALVRLACAAQPLAKRDPAALTDLLREFQTKHGGIDISPEDAPSSFLRTTCD